MKFEIKSRWSGSVIFSVETDSWRLAVEAAVRAKADLRGADLRGADLRGASLRGADLREADLRGASLRGDDLREADLRGASLYGASLRGADLREADLRGADLYGASLRWANLREADLRGADLRGADLRGAELRGANLTVIRDDLWAVLSSAAAEVDRLRAAIMEGHIDGSTYEGDCACLVGTIANVRHCKYDAMPGLTPNSSRPIERFFLAIRKGDTPETSQFSQLALEWTDQWLANMRGAFSKEQVAP